MILLNNSPLGLSSYAEFIGKTNYQRIEGKLESQNFDSLGHGKISIPDKHMESFIKYIGDDSVYTTAADLLNIAKDKLAGFSSVLAHVNMNLSGKDLKSNVNITNDPLGVGRTTWGLATLTWLIQNRASRTNLNDLTFMAMCARETGVVALPAYSPSKFTGSGLTTGISKPFQVCVSPAYAADIAHDKDHNVVPGCTSGFGSRQPGWWEYGKRSYTTRTSSLGTERKTSLVPEADYNKVYYILGCLPWWAQAIFAAMDIRTRASRSMYLQATAPVPPDPTFRESFYPYYLFEQPGLNDMEILKYVRSGSMQGVEKIIAREKIGVTLETLLLEGARGVRMSNSPLFQGELTDTQWLALVSGLNTASILDYNLETAVDTPLAKTGLADLILSQKYVATDITSNNVLSIDKTVGISKVRTMAESGDTGLVDLVYTERKRPAYEISREIKLF
jgi:hypothetical protein